MVSRTIVPALALLVGLATPLSVQAQAPPGKFTFSPSFRVNGVYDDNLFSTASSEPLASYFLRFTPAFTTGYEGTSFSFDAGYAIFTSYPIGASASGAAKPKVPTRLPVVDKLTSLASPRSPKRTWLSSANNRILCGFTSR